VKLFCTPLTNEPDIKKITIAIKYMIPFRLIIYSLG
jgi:hypothetical protein